MKLLPRLLVVSLSGWLLGCGVHKAPAPPPPPPKPQALPVTPFTGPVIGTEVQVLPDRVAGIIAKVEEEFAAGRAEWERGRFATAREHFDAAVNQMLSLPEGARGEPRLQKEYEQLLDRITALELLALHEGDGL